MYNFDIYCGQLEEGEGRSCGLRGQSMVASEVVTKLTTGLEYLGQCITMDNYFISIPLFVELCFEGNLCHRYSESQPHWPSIAS